MRGGVYLTLTMEDKTASARGIIFSDGHLTRNSLLLTGGSKDAEFYRGTVIPTMDHAFNMLQDDLYDYTQPSGFSGDDYTFLGLDILLSHWQHTSGANLISDGPKRKEWLKDFQKG